MSFGGFPLLCPPLKLTFNVRFLTTKLSETNIVWVNQMQVGENFDGVQSKRMSLRFRHLLCRLLVVQDDTAYKTHKVKRRPVNVRVFA